MAIGVRYEYDHGLKLDDGSEFWCDDLGVFGAPSSVMAAVSLTSLRHALGRHAQVWGPGDAELWVLGDSPDRFDEETSEPLPYRLVVRDGQLVVAVDVPESSLGLADEEIEAAIAPVIYRHGAESLGVWIAEWREATFRRVALHVPTARRTARTAFQLGQEVLQTLDLRVHGKPDHAWFVRILESGLWNLLCDLEETSWLEAKREHYRNDARGELDFASDVAALCNCEGGVLIIGAKTKRHPDGDRIVAVNQCPLPPGTVRRYEQLLRRLVVPVPVGLRIAPLRDPDHRGQGLLLIEVPAQSPDVRPFAVGGAHVGASVHGAMIGVPVRRGADTDWMKIEALQALLRAGRAAVGIRT